LLSLRIPPSDAALLAWSPDGKRLSAADGTGAVHIWDASRAYEFTPGGSRRGDLARAYQQLANESTGEARDFAMRRVVELAPRTLDYRDLRGPALAQLGDFDAAAKEFAAAVPPQAELGLLFAICQADALLGARDMDAYRHLCKRLVHAVEDSTLWSKRLFVAWRAALIPGAVDGFEENVKLIRDDLAKSASEGKGGLESVVHVCVLYYGAMLYRLEAYDDAVEALMTLPPRFAQGSDKSGQYTLACAQYFLAMARFQLGHTFQARRLLDQARATDNALRNDPSTIWSKHVVLNTLEREATELIIP
jgi:tetratricopeptide (TPR) repeat protein